MYIHRERESIVSSASAFNLNQSKVLLFDQELIFYQVSTWRACQNLKHLADDNNNVA